MEKNLKCILLIDDDPPTNFINTKIIESAEIKAKIKSYESAENALKYLRDEESDVEGLQPDLIFLDINMPGMDGWEFLKQYDLLPEEKRSSMVLSILTTSINPEDERLAKECENVNAFFSKPLKKENIQRLIDEHFEN